MPTLSTPTVNKTFPQGTVEELFTFILSGTNADGSAYSSSTTSTSSSTTFTLPSGTFNLVVTKNGESSLPSDTFTVAVPTPVTLSVPDPSQKATITA